MTSPPSIAHAGSYDIFGESVSVFAADEEVAGLAHTALEPFSTRRPGTSIAEFHIRRHDCDSPVRQGRQLHSGSLMVTADRHKLITASLATRPWRIYIDAFGRDPEYVFYYLFEPLLHMVLMRRGLAHWHGAAVQQRNGRDILIVGPSGSGKSTTALCLLSNGYAYIADDELFLDSRDGLVRARSAEKFLHLTAATANLLPALPARSGLPFVPRGQGRKYRLDSAAFSTATAGDIRCVLFPSVREDTATRCEPISQAETLRRLLTHPPKEYPAVVADPPAVQSQFDICAALATRAAAYDVSLGRDLDRLPRLVDELLQ